MQTLQKLIEIINDGRGLWLPMNQIDEVDSIDDAFSFYRDYVSRNLPLVIKGGCKSWKAFKKWRFDDGKINTNYMITQSGNPKITVAKTPNGLADAILASKEIFTLPFEDESLNLSDFFELELENQAHVSYIQKQCDSLNLEFPLLSQDLEEFEWARKAFGLPDAVNLWIGNKRAISSLHKDPYENIYCVINGQKNFTLLAPSDTPFLYRQSYPVWKYNNKMELELVEPCMKIPWIPVDPETPDYDKYPLFRNATPFHVTLDPGDVLYLPSLWYHKVRQSDDTIAVNFWYDMKYNMTYAMTCLLESWSISD